MGKKQKVIVVPPPKLKLDDAHDMPTPWAMTHSSDRERAVVLLGARRQTDLSVKKAAELVALVGVYPTREQAVRWKRWLKLHK